MLSLMASLTATGEEGGRTLSEIRNLMVTNNAHLEDILAVTPEEIEEGCAAVSEEFRAVLRQAAENIAEYHRNQIRSGFVMTRPKGVVLGQIVRPIERVGLYVPNGTAAYPSSLLMNCIPAKIAGCGLLVTVTPPDRNGKVSPAILAAAREAGIEPVVEPIRGGTDGARLSYMGLPCPNLGTGGAACHGPYEHTTVEQMEKVVAMLENLIVK